MNGPMKRKEKQGLTQRAYADWRRRRNLPGGSPQSVCAAVKDGRIKEAIWPDGSIDAKRADELWAQRAGRQGRLPGVHDRMRRLAGIGHASNGTDGGADPVVDHDEAKRLLTIEQGRLAKAKADEAERILVSADEVASTWASIAIVTRTRVLAVPVSGRLAFLTHEQRETLRDELTAALEDVAEQATMAGAEPAEETTP